ncbi:methyltransferase domain-containing protein [Acinetobacter wanghuae]|uniref:Methyltransferase domain-containing protein n=1 Tax=Acinetobacter wanghuae TaxID=2662362 RepID=A0A5Q0P1K5_9GAMM|nr:class I SAM-dependent methyltransferase [Acinetobacter wanghuae]MQW92178.1 methyltransferase domain-containing protein [Acinetobacter wanghuae]QGA10654.1 methyltransferase domain-containing protein [Acinetobacter wanghuae]
MKRNQGYVTDTVFPAFFYKEMQPEWLNTITQFLGFKGVDFTAPFSYLELACGTGINLIVAAMNHPQSYFVGVDFNSQHIREAQAFAEQLELKNIAFIEADFQTFYECNQTQFDFITVHGAYSWVAPIQQQEILAITAKFLKSQGIFYLHYMCYPGSLHLQPVQKLFNLIDQHVPTASTESIQLGKALFNDLHEHGAFVDQPQMEALLNTLNNSSDYLTHELLTDHWQPLYSVDVHQQAHQLSGLTYIGSAEPTENLDSISIPNALQPMVSKVKIPELKEYLKDLARNSKQRTDIYQKHPIQLQQNEHLEVLKQMKFELVHLGANANVTKFQTPIGEMIASEKLIEKMLTAFAHEKRGFNDFIQLTEFQQNPIYLIETLFLLLSNQYIYPVKSSGNKRNQIHSDQFNQFMEVKKIALRFKENSPIPIYVS